MIAWEWLARQAGPPECSWEYPGLSAGVDGPPPGLTARSRVSGPIRHGCPGAWRRVGRDGGRRGRNPYGVPGFWRGSAAGERRDAALRGVRPRGRWRSSPSGPGGVAGGGKPPPHAEARRAGAPQTNQLAGARRERGRAGPPQSRGSGAGGERRQPRERRALVASTRRSPCRASSASAAARRGCGSPRRAGGRGARGRWSRGRSRAAPRGPRPWRRGR
jgi:hypothetical protein